MEEKFSLSDGVFSIDRMICKIENCCKKYNLPETPRALAFAQEKHAGQMRKSDYHGRQMPYLVHPLLITCHAISLGLYEDEILSTCLLHDVCEDCGVLTEDLPVNEKTKQAVRLLTKPADFDKSDEAERRYYGGIVENRIAVIVKLLDRCNNISDMGTSFSGKNILAYMDETANYVYPLFDRALKSWPEYTNELFLIRYHMNSVLNTLQFQLENQDERSGIENEV